MITPQQFERLVQALPILSHADPVLLREFQQAASFMRIPAGHDVFIEGDRVDAIALLISGSCGYIRSARPAGRSRSTASGTANPAS